MQSITKNTKNMKQTPKAPENINPPITRLNGLRPLFLKACNNMLFFNTSRRMAACTMAAREVPSFRGIFRFVEGSWSIPLHVEFVGFLFATLGTEGCGLHWMPVVNEDRRPLGRIPTAIRRKCKMEDGYLGNHKIMIGELILSMTTRIKEAHSLPTFLWRDVLIPFPMGVPPNLTRHWCCLHDIPLAIERTMQPRCNPRQEKTQF